MIKEREDAKLGESSMSIGLGARTKAPGMLSEYLTGTIVEQHTLGIFRPTVRQVQECSWADSWWVELDCGRLAGGRTHSFSIFPRYTI